MDTQKKSKKQEDDTRAMKEIVDSYSDCPQFVDANGQMFVDMTRVVPKKIARKLA